MGKGGTNPKKKCPSCGMDWKSLSDAQKARHLERCLG